MKSSSPSGLHQDRPLPGNVLEKTGGWWGRAQHYPVFSTTWFYWRSRSFALPLLAIGLVLLILAIWFAHVATRVEPGVYLALASFWLMIATSLLGGRWLATKVCQQGWSEARQAKGVVAAIACGVVLAMALSFLTHIQGNSYHNDAWQNKSESGPHRPASESATRSADDPNAIYLNSLVNLILVVWWGGSLDLVTYFRQRRALREAAMQEKIDHYQHERNQVEIRLSILASQVEPHFLFNTLAGVRAAILNDPQRGVVMIDSLVEYLRSTIPQMRSDSDALFVPLAQQLHSARAYLGVIRARMARLSFEVESDPALKDALMPPLMLISLVENAVTHGIEPKKGPAHIRIEARLIATDAPGASPRMAISVSDNGVGFGGTSSGSGIGLNNIRERLQYLYGDTAGLTLTALPDGGVQATISLPVTPVPTVPTAAS